MLERGDWIAQQGQVTESARRAERVDFAQFLYVVVYEYERLQAGQAWRQIAAYVSEEK